MQNALKQAWHIVSSQNMLVVVVFNIIIMNTHVGAALGKFMSALFTIRKRFGMIQGMYITHMCTSYTTCISKTLIIFYSYFFKENTLNINRGFLWAAKIMLLFVFFCVSSKFLVVSTIFYNLAFLKDK